MKPFAAASIHDGHALHGRLEELDRELEDGDITQKGYEKRRTLLLTEHLNLAPSGSPASSFSRSHSRNVSSVSHSSLNGSGMPPELGADPYARPSSFYRDDSPAPARQPQTMRNPSARLSIGPDTFMSQHSDGSSFNNSRTATMARADFAFNPSDHVVVGAPAATDYNSSSQGESRMSTMLNSQQYFSDFTGQQMQEPPRDKYGGPQRYSTGEALPYTVRTTQLNAREMDSRVPVSHQMPLEPREIPFNVFDPHNKTVPMLKFDNIGAVLRYRGKTVPRQPAYWVLDTKGKEMASITWEKLSSKAEKVAQIIRDKSNLYRGDRVALVYRDNEVIDFAIALMGCFIAGVVAVPVNCVDDYQKLSLLLTTTQAHLALTTDNNLKTFHRDINANKLKWPTGVEWWKTNEFGSYHAKRKDDQPHLQVPDLAYIEFSRAPTGDLRGVVLSHRTVMHQMACVSAMLQSVPKSNAQDLPGDGIRDRNGQYIAGSSKQGEIILSYLDPREGVGMILGVLLGVYGGHTTVWMEPKTVDTAGLYAHLITRYRASVLVADYSRLKFAAYNYQQDPMTTRNFKKGMEPNFSSVKICLIDTLTVDPEFHEILADRWFKPMRNDRARDVVAPMLCLPEHGGMIMSVRDWLGGEERMGCPLSGDVIEEVTEHDGERSPDARNNGSKHASSRRVVRKQTRSDLSEVLLDKEALKTNEVVVLATGDEVKRRVHEPGTIRAGAFGYPIADATLAVVDPETNLLCSPYHIGEIWVDSPSLSGGFWSLPKHTETIFHARPYRFVDASPTPLLLDMEFLRTGLLGCAIEGKIYILGLYEDRIRQKVEWSDPGITEGEHRYFFVQHLVASIVRNIHKIHDW